VAGGSIARTLHRRTKAQSPPNQIRPFEKCSFSRLSNRAGAFCYWRIRQPLLTVAVCLPFPVVSRVACGRECRPAAAELSRELQTQVAEKNRSLVMRSAVDQHEWLSTCADRASHELSRGTTAAGPFDCQRYRRENLEIHWSLAGSTHPHALLSCVVHPGVARGDHDGPRAKKGRLELYAAPASIHRPDGLSGGRRLVPPFGDLAIAAEAEPSQSFLDYVKFRPGFWSGSANHGPISPTKMTLLNDLLVPCLRPS
jgi:hypothetical protein